ncbi:MAG: RNA-binding protein [Xanthobacteraceae bacterium]
MLAHVHDSELDNGPRMRTERARHCVVTRTVRPIDELIRFVVGPDGTLVPDAKGKLPGRGVWVTATRAELAEGIKRKVFARAFRREVNLPPDLLAVTEGLLERSALDALAMAGKARRVVVGSAKVEAALREHSITALLHAADAAEDGVRKLDAALRRRMGAEGEQIPVIDMFSGVQLDLALARSNVIHAALVTGPESATFLARSLRLARFRTGISGDAAGRNPPPN